MPIPKTVTINHKKYRLHGGGGYNLNDAKKFAKIIEADGKYLAVVAQRGVIGFEKTYAIYVRNRR